MLGCGGIAVFGWFALVDNTALNQADAEFLRLIDAGSDLPTLFVAESRQRIHRINLFAEGVWTLQCAVFAAIGLHGICTIAPGRGRSI